MDGDLSPRFPCDERLDLSNSPTPGRIDVIERIRSRRDWPDEEELRIVAAAFAPGARVVTVAKHLAMSPSQIYTWRQLIRDGVLGGRNTDSPFFAEVQVAHGAGAVSGYWAMEIRLVSGIRIGVDATVDQDALARVLSALQR